MILRQRRERCRGQDTVDRIPMTYSPLTARLPRLTPHVAI